MGLSREPSQRARNWVTRWNSTKSTKSSHSSRHAAPEPKIVHLGGARVGTAFEELDIPVIDRPRPDDNEHGSIAEWAYNSPPAPNSSGIGIAVVEPDGSTERNTSRDESDNDRPITQWFQTEWTPPAERVNPRAKKSPPAPIKETPRDRGMRTAFPYAASNDSGNDENLLSPSTPSYLASDHSFEDKLVSPALTATTDAYSVSSYNEPPSPDSATPFPLSVPLVARVVETASPRSVAFPKRSTSLSQASRRVHPRAPRQGPQEAADDAAAAAADAQVDLRRTQSNAEAQKPGSWRSMSTRHARKPSHANMSIEESVSEEAELETEPSPGPKFELKDEPRTDARTEPETLRRIEQKTQSPFQQETVGERQRQSPSPPKHLNPNNVRKNSPKPSPKHSPQSSLQSLPPIGPPPNVPLPQISATKLAGQGKARDQLHLRTQSTSSSGSNQRVSPLTPRDQPMDYFNLHPQGEEPGHTHLLPPTQYQPPRHDEQKGPAQQHGQQEQPQPQPQAQPQPQKQDSLAPPDQTKQKMSSKERFWLHRHYKGEANFLRAWGLQITSDEDREEGLRILRELMRGEEEEERERENQEKRYMHYRSGSSSRASTATSSTSAMREGNSPVLDVIAEESQGRGGFRDSSATITSETDMDFWKTDRNDINGGNSSGSQRAVPSFSNSRIRPERHVRTESDSSVLGTYLDLRMSRDST